VRRLLDGAAAHRRDNGRLTQLHAELADGDLFAVTGPEERTIVAVTAGRVSPGLLFHDLKRCLAVISAGSTGGEAAAARRQDRPAERGPGADET
jgi:hypothetical protein